MKASSGMLSSAVGPECTSMRTALLRYADTTPAILSILVYGSHLRGDASRSSDLDLCIFSEDPSSAVQDLLRFFRTFPGAVCYAKAGNGKLIAYVPCTACTLLRVDCLVDQPMSSGDPQKLIVGSELTHDRIDAAVWYSASQDMRRQVQCPPPPPPPAPPAGTKVGHI